MFAVATKRSAQWNQSPGRPDRDRPPWPPLHSSGVSPLTGVGWAKKAAEVTRSTRSLPAIVPPCWEFSQIDYLARLFAVSTNWSLINHWKRGVSPLFAWPTKCVNKVSGRDPTSGHCWEAGGKGWRWRCGCGWGYYYGMSRGTVGKERERGLAVLIRGWRPFSIPDKFRNIGDKWRQTVLTPGSSRHSDTSLLGPVFGAVKAERYSYGVLWSPSSRNIIQHSWHLSVNSLCIYLPFLSCRSLKSPTRFPYCLQSSGTVWKSRWPSWAFRPNEPYGFCGRKATLNHAHALVTVCP